jgi:hypothetical protein
MPICSCQISLVDYVPIHDLYVQEHVAPYQRPTFEREFLDIISGSLQHSLVHVFNAFMLKPVVKRCLPMGTRDEDSASTGNCISCSAHVVGQDLADDSDPFIRFCIRAVRSNDVVVHFQLGGCQNMCHSSTSGSDWPLARQEVQSRPICYGAVDVTLIVQRVQAFRKLL